MVINWGYGCRFISASLLQFTDIEIHDCGAVYTTHCHIHGCCELAACSNSSNSSRTLPPDHTWRYALDLCLFNWCEWLRIELLNIRELTFVSCNSNLISLNYFYVMPRKSVINICRSRTINHNETIENGHLNNSLQENKI